MTLSKYRPTIRWCTSPRISRITYRGHGNGELLTFEITHGFPAFTELGVEVQHIYMVSDR